MASKRLGPPPEGVQSDSSNKKLKIEVPAPKALCGISDITPQTATHPPPQSINNTTLPTPANTSAIAIDTETPTSPATTKPSNDALYTLWIVLEHFQPNQELTNDGFTPMVKVLGLFTNPTAALEHAEEHVRALRTVTTEGIRPEPENEEEDEREDDEMSVTSVYERKLEVFRNTYEGEEETEDNGHGEGSSGGDGEVSGEEGSVKAWTVRWGNVTEVRVEKREVFESKAGAGYFTPLPIEGEDERD